MALPTVVGTPPYQNKGTGSLTLAGPTCASGDLVLVFCMCISTESLPTTVSQSPPYIAATDSPYTAFTGSPWSDGTSNKKLYAFWARATTTSIPAAATGDAGTLQQYCVVVVNGAIASGTPYEALTGGTDTGANLTIPSITTLGPDRLIVGAVTTNYDGTAQQFSAWTNANLASPTPTEQGDQCTNTGTGSVPGGLAAYVGGYAADADGAATGATTATQANASNCVYAHFAVLPTAATEYNDTPSGTLTVSGTISESWYVETVYTDTPSGSAATSGSVTESWGRTYEDVVSGTLVPGGTPGDSYSHDSTRSGSLTVTGTIVEGRVYTDTVGGVVAGATYVDTVVADGADAYWRFGESSGAGTAVDYAGAADLTYNGSPALEQTGIVGGEGDTAVLLDGTETATTSGNPTELDLANTFTIEFWVKRARSGVVEAVYSRQAVNAQTINLRDDRIALEQQNVGVLVSSSIQITDTSWHHVVVTKSGSTMKIWIDGEDRTGTPTDYTFSTYTGLLVVGAYAWGGYGLNATLDEFAVYKGTALSSTQVADHYDLGTNGPSSASGAIITPSGTISESWGISFTDTPSGTAALTGTVAESSARTDTATGSAALSGAVSESKSHDNTATGAATLSGSIVESWGLTNTDTPTGTAALAGTIVESQQHEYIDTATGTATAAGTNAETLERTTQPSGTAVLSGSLVEEFVPPSATYNDSPSGTASLSASTRTESFGAADSGTGVTTLSGTISESASFGYVDQPSGQMAAAGTAGESHDGADQPTGAIAATGVTAEAFEAAETVAGIAILSGTVQESWTLGYSDQPTGQATLTGSAAEAYGHTEARTGTVTATGVATEAFEQAVTPTGQATITGTVAESWSHDAAPTATATLTGTIVESGGVGVHDDYVTGSLTLTGTAVDAAGVAVTGTLTLTGHSGNEWQGTYSGNDEATYSGVDTATYAGVGGATYDPEF